MTKALEQAARQLLSAVDAAHLIGGQLAVDSASTELRAALEAQPQHWSDCLPTPAMCRAAVEYLNGDDVYTKVPREALDIEEGIYREVWLAMQAKAPSAQPEADGFVMVPVEVKSLYDFMTDCFVPFTSQQEEIAISLKMAKQAMAKPPVAQPDRHTLQADGKHPSPCARFCEANAFSVEIRRLEAKIAELEAQPAVQPLTDEQIKPLIPADMNWRYVVGEAGAIEFAREIERLHGIGAKP